MAGRPIPTVEELLTRLRELGSPERIAGQQRYGIHGREQWGVSMPDIRAVAKGVKDHRLALDLWQTAVHEAQLLAALIDRPQWVTREQMDAWVVDFDSWDLVDQTCMNLFDPTPFCWDAASSWMEREDEFVRRAGFVLIASRSVHDKSAPDSAFTAYFPAALRHCDDNRIYVKKAINWMLRQIGKRNETLRIAALGVCDEIQATGSPSARWIASDAIRELSSPAVIARLQKKAKP